MALAHSLHTQKHFALRDAVVHFVSVLVEKRTRYVNYRKTLTELEAMSDRDLDDIGIVRGSIREIAYMTAYGK